VFFGGIGSVLISLCQAEERFLWQAVVPVVSACLQLALVVAFGRQMGARALALATLAGTVAQVSLLVPPLLKRGRYRIRASPLAPAVRALVREVLPVIGSRILSDATSIVDRYLASMMVVGTIARLNYSQKIPALTLSLFSTGIAVTIFPLLSRAAAVGELGEFRRAVSAGTRYTWLFFLPFMVMMSVLAGPTVATLFQRGKFSPLDTDAVALLLPWYMISMSARALGNVTSRALYALRQARLMAALNAVSVVTYVGTALALVPRFGIVGLPIAAVVNDWVFYGVHCMFIWRHSGRTVEPGLALGVARITVAAVVAGGLSWLVRRGFPTAAPPVQLILGGGVGVVAFIAGLFLARAPELQLLFRVLRPGVASGTLPVDGVGQ